MIFAYADPPYIGQAKLYKNEAVAKEVNHPLLIAHLNEFDGWALSASSTTLQQLLPMCPDDVRVMAWVKPFASFKRGVSVAYAWEPVIVRGGRPYPSVKRHPQDYTRDWVAASITLQTGLVGAKPAKFSHWLFTVLNIQFGDELVDIFPGTNNVTRALAGYLEQRGTPLPLFETPT